MKKIAYVLLVVLVFGVMSVPAFAASDDPGAVTVPAGDLILNFFPSIFEGISTLFQSPPMLYLFSIFIFSFIVLIFKLIFHF